MLGTALNDMMQKAVGDDKNAYLCVESITVLKLMEQTPPCV